MNFFSKLFGENEASKDGVLAFMTSLAGIFKDFENRIEEDTGYSLLLIGKPGSADFKMKLHNPHVLPKDLKGSARSSFVRAVHSIAHFIADQSKSVLPNLSEQFPFLFPSA